MFDLRSIIPFFEHCFSSFPESEQNSGQKTGKKRKEYILDYLLSQNFITISYPQEKNRDLKRQLAEKKKRKRKKIENREL